MLECTPLHALAALALAAAALLIGLAPAIHYALKQPRRNRQIQRKKDTHHVPSQTGSL